jgi:hypothetical protein
MPLSQYIFRWFKYVFFTVAGKESILPSLQQERVLSDDNLRPGTTKRRQYYYKRVATSLTG